MPQNYQKQHIGFFGYTQWINIHRNKAFTPCEQQQVLKISHQCKPSQGSTFSLLAHICMSPVFLNLLSIASKLKLRITVSISHLHIMTVNTHQKINEQNESEEHQTYLPRILQQSIHLHKACTQVSQYTKHEAQNGIFWLCWMHILTPF